MGSESSVSEQTQQHHSLNHPKLKIVKYVHNNQIMKAYINIEHSDEFHEWEQRLAQLHNFDEYFLLLPKSYSFGRKAVCGSSGVLQADYDNFPYLLSDQISNRTPHSNYFTQTQLWYLLYGLVSSASLFSKINSKVGDMQSKNIFLNEQGQIKISNLCSWPAQHTNYQKLIFQHVPTYVSPQQLQYSKQGRVDIYKNSSTDGSCDKYLCQSFSIGMTMLQSVLLNSSADLYDSRRKIIDRQQLNRRINRLLQSSSYTNINGISSMYSHALKVAIAGLCQFKAQDRILSLDLYNWLKQYDSQISNLKPCNVDVPPAKLKHKYEQVINSAQNNNQRVPSNTINNSPNININPNINTNPNNNINNTISANSKQLFGNPKYENVYQTNYNNRYDNYNNDKRYTNINYNNNINNSPMDSRSSAQYLMMTPPSSTSAYQHSGDAKSLPTTSAYNNTNAIPKINNTINTINTINTNNTNSYNNAVPTYMPLSTYSMDSKIGYDGKSGYYDKYGLNYGNSTSTTVGFNPNVSIGYNNNNTGVGVGSSALGGATSSLPYTNTSTSIGNALYGTSYATSLTNNIPTTTALTNVNSFGTINTPITNNNTLLKQDNKYNKYDTTTTYKPNNQFTNKDILNTNKYNNNDTIYTYTNALSNPYSNPYSSTAGNVLGSAYNTAEFGYPSSLPLDKTDTMNINMNINIGTKFGSGNAYLQDIYSVEAKTPTFSNSTQLTSIGNKLGGTNYDNKYTTSSSNYANKDITFDTKNTNLYVGTIDNYMNKQPISINTNSYKDTENKLVFNTTFGNLNSNKASNLGNTSNQYSFSNISSIPREDPLSANKVADSVNVFTPTHTYNANMGDTKNKYDDSSTDLLKKINEEIMKTKQKYSVDDHSP